MPDTPSLLSHWPLLSWMLLTPLVGALVVWLVPGARLSRWVQPGSLLIALGFSLAVVWRFNPAEAGFQLVEETTWIPSLNVHYLIGMDGISVLFPPLTLLLFLGTNLASWTGVRTLRRLHDSLMLLLASAMLGIFCALDLMFFFLCWEMTLIPIYFLISLWGPGPHRRYAAVKYSLFMLAGGVPLLFGFILLAFNHAEVTGAGVPAGLSWDYRELLATPLAQGLETSVFLLLLAGFAVKTPVFPLHTWLPVVAMEGPAAVAALITGLKVGAYGLIRFALPLAPGAAQEFHWLLAGLGTVGLLYGALAAMGQTNLRRLLAYASLSHVGLVLLGIASLSEPGVQGALFQLLNFTLVAGGLFLLTRFLNLRLGSTDLISLGGVARSMPLLAAFYFFLSLASLGVPGTSGFPAEFLILVSALQNHTGAGLAALLAMVLGAAYVLDGYRRTFFGPLGNRAIAAAADLRPRELLVAIAFSLPILAAGLYPAGVLDTLSASTSQWVERFATRAP
ncbi:MAG: NADH-quinone oxidoreductase subunit M [Chromatiaceae bacterium]